jgi:hypothetical protein
MVKKNRFDDLKLGTILGLVVPVLGFLIFYLWNFTKWPFSVFVEFVIQKAAISKVLSLSLLPNLLVFFLYIRKNYYLTARGILMSTIIWTFTIVIVKFFIE